MPGSRLAEATGFCEDNSMVVSLTSTWAQRTFVQETGLAVFLFLLWLVGVLEPAGSEARRTHWLCVQCVPSRKYGADAHSLLDSLGGAPWSGLPPREHQLKALGGLFDFLLGSGNLQGACSIYFQFKKELSTCCLGVTGWKQRKKQAKTS